MAILTPKISYGRCRLRFDCRTDRPFRCEASDFEGFRIGDSGGKTRVLAFHIQELLVDTNLMKINRKQLISPDSLIGFGILFNIKHVFRTVAFSCRSFRISQYRPPIQ